MDDRERIIEAAKAYADGCNSYLGPEWRARRDDFLAGASSVAARWEQRVRPLIEAAEAFATQAGAIHAVYPRCVCSSCNLRDALAEFRASGGSGK